MKAFIREFKTFLNRGNVLDLAVGVIIGGAFKSITDSLTNDILLPLLGLLVHRGSFSDLTLPPGSATTALGSVFWGGVNFIIMAFAVFCIVKAFNRLHRKKEEAAPAPKPSKEELLLTEIRDLLKEGK